MAFAWIWSASSAAKHPAESHSPCHQSSLPWGMSRDDSWPGLRSAAVRTVERVGKRYQVALAVVRWWSRPTIQLRIFAATRSQSFSTDYGLRVVSPIRHILPPLCLPTVLTISIYQHSIYTTFQYQITWRFRYGTRFSDQLKVRLIFEGKYGMYLCIYEDVLDLLPVLNIIVRNTTSHYLHGSNAVYSLNA